MKAIEVINQIGKAEVMKRNLCCRNVKYFFGSFECDVLSLNKNNNLTEFEVKVSRGDFMADRKKRRFTFLSFPSMYYDYCPNYFYYAVPENLVTRDEVPDWAGLVYVTGDGVFLQKKARLLREKEFDKATVLEKFLRVSAEREYLGCCMLTLKNREAQKRYDEWHKQNEATVF